MKKGLENILIESWYNRTLPEISLEGEWEGKRRMLEKDWKKSVKRDLKKYYNPK